VTEASLKLTVDPRLVRLTFLGADGKPTPVRVNGGDTVVSHWVRNVDPRMTDDDLAIAFAQELGRHGTVVTDVRTLESSRARVHFGVTIRTDSPPPLRKSRKKALPRGR